MKKLVVLFILAALILPYQSALAIVQSSVVSDDVVPPNWEEYVPEKYKNPRMFSRGKSTDLQKQQKSKTLLKDKDIMII